MAESADSGPLVAIVDDQRDVRTTLGKGLGRMGYRCHPFASGQDLVDALDYLEPDCILLDMRMPGLDGLETLRQIPANRRHIPVIFFTSHGDIALAVEAMKTGAADFVEKPGSLAQISEKIDAALAARPQGVAGSHEAAQARELIGKLTEREREVMQFVCEGFQSKEIADKLDLSVRTIDSHRHHAIQKLGDSKLVSIIRIFEAAGAD